MVVRVTKSPEQRKEELIETAMRLFTTRGYERTAVSDIVREMKVAQGTFYYYFKSKQEILEEMARRAIFSLVDSIEEIADSEEIDAVAKLNRFLDAMVRSGYSSHPLTDVIHQESNVALHHKLARISISRLVPLLGRILEEGRQAGTFAIEHSDHVARLLLLAVGAMFHDPEVVRDSESVEKARQTVERCTARVLGLGEGVVKLNFDVTGE